MKSFPSSLVFAVATWTALCCAEAHAAPNPLKVATKKLVLQSKTNVKAMREAFKEARTDLFAAVGALEAALKTNVDVASATSGMFAALHAFQTATQSATDGCLDAIGNDAFTELHLWSVAAGSTDVPREFALGQRSTLDALRRVALNERARHYAQVDKRLTLLTKRAAAAGTPVAIHVEPPHEDFDVTVDLSPSPLRFFHRPIAIDAYFAIAGTVYVFGTGSVNASPVTVVAWVIALDGSIQATSNPAVLASYRFLVGISAASGSNVILATEDVEPFIESHAVLHMP